MQTPCEPNDHGFVHTDVMVFRGFQSNATHITADAAAILPPHLGFNDVDVCCTVSKELHPERADAYKGTEGPKVERYSGWLRW